MKPRQIDDEDKIAVRCFPATTYLSDRQIEQLKLAIGGGKPPGDTVTITVTISGDGMAELVRRRFNAIK